MNASEYPACHVCGDTRIVWSPTLDGESMNKSDCPAQIHDETRAGPQTCEVDGETQDTYGGEHYWHCGNPGGFEVNGLVMCEDHAGELGFGPKQEDYGYEPQEDKEAGL